MTLDSDDIRNLYSRLKRLESIVKDNTVWKIFSVFWSFIVAVWLLSLTIMLNCCSDCTPPTPEKFDVVVSWNKVQDAVAYKVYMGDATKQYRLTTKPGTYENPQYDTIPSIHMYNFMTFVVDTFIILEDTMTYYIPSIGCPFPLKTYILPDSLALAVTAIKPHPNIGTWYLESKYSVPVYVGVMMSVDTVTGEVIR